MDNSSEVKHPRGAHELTDLRPNGDDAAPPISSASDVPVPQGRNPWGWILLAVLFVLVSGTSVARSFQQEKVDDPRVRTAERSLELQISFAELAKGKGVAAKDLPQGLEKARRELGDAPPEAALLRMAIDRELGRKPSPRDARLARQLPPELVPALGYVTEEQPKSVAAANEREPFVLRLAKSQARERAGLPRPEARSGLVMPGFATRYGFFLFGVLAAVATAVVLWLIYGLTRASGGFVPKGAPSLPMSPAEADRFALRGAMLFAAFLIGGTVAGLAPGPLAVKMALQVVLYVGMAVYSIRLPRDPIASRLSSAGFGVDLKEFGQRVAWGVAGAVANLPIILLVSAIAGFVLKNAPAPTHPSSEMLLHNPDLAQILMTFLFASICAPIWEETFFRGLLFQGLAARIAPIGAALLSSFLFASIHPQGIAGWPALATVALMSCALLAQTRSLVSSIFMHVTHNTLTLLMALVAGPLVGRIVGLDWSSVGILLGAGR